VYFTTLLVIHVLGAIAGIGPTFAFGVLGRASRSAGAPAIPALLEAMIVIAGRVVTPVALVTQPVTGVLLVFETGRNHDFFRHEWLWTSILAYGVVLVLSYLVDLPRLRRMLALAREGGTGSEEFRRLSTSSKRLGPLYGVLTVAIVVLMIWKPGDGPYG
jgi:uncharacterized membrane protein